MRWIIIITPFSTKKRSPASHGSDASLRSVAATGTRRFEQPFWNEENGSACELHHTAGCRPELVRPCRPRIDAHDDEISIGRRRHAHDLDARPAAGHDIAPIATRTRHRTDRSLEEPPKVLFDQPPGLIDVRVGPRGSFPAFRKDVKDRHIRADGTRQCE